MNLKNFHILFVVASMTLSGWFGIFCLGEGGDVIGSFSAMYGIVSLITTVGLGIYGVRTYRKLSKLVQEL